VGDPLLAGGVAVRGKPIELRDEDAKARRDRTALLGVLVLALAVALAGVARPHARHAPQSPTQRARVGVGDSEPPASAGVAASPADAPAAGGLSPVTATGAPRPDAPQFDPPSPADSKAFNGAGFAPPVVPPEARPVVVPANPQQAAGVKGPLYYQTEGQMHRAAADSRKLAQLQTRSATRRGGE
jgi:hypothetical protein